LKVTGELAKLELQSAFGQKILAELINLPAKTINSGNPVLLTCALVSEMGEQQCYLSMADYKILKQAEDEGVTKEEVEEWSEMEKTVTAYVVKVEKVESSDEEMITNDFINSLDENVIAENVKSWEGLDAKTEITEMKAALTEEQVYAVGVVFDDDTDFGDIEYYEPKTEQDRENIEKIDQVDLGHLTEMRQKELRGVLKKYRKVFSDIPGRCNLAKHEIRLKPDFIPKPRRPYRIPEKLKGEVDRQIEELLCQNRIRPSQSCFAHPIVCVVKKQGEIRLCCDFRNVNSGTIPDAYPIPVIDEMLNKISPANFITSLDCTAGYWQIEMNPESVESTAFITDSGLYEWLVMPFGVLNASSTYQRVMNRVLEAHKRYACAYIDDASIYSIRWEDHLEHLSKVLKSIQEAGLTLRLSKCAFAQSHIKFLGHEIGSGDKNILPEKLETLRAIQPPTSKKLVRSVLGMFGFFRTFIPNFAEIAAPLTEMTKGRSASKFVLNEPQLAAFEQLKRELCSNRTLKPPDYTRPFKIYTDASNLSAAACLTQEIDGNDRPVAFASAKFTDVQRNWSVIEKESFAVIFALRKFDKYIFGYHIELFTDHNPLQYLAKTIPQSAKLTRWALALQRYDIEIKHVAGKLNHVADYLSRC